MGHPKKKAQRGDKWTERCTELPFNREVTVSTAKDYHTRPTLNINYHKITQSKCLTAQYDCINSGH